MNREIDPLKWQNRPQLVSGDRQHGHMESGPATAQRIESCLRAMGAVMADDRIPLAVRDAVCVAHRKLHACRDELTVRRMEWDMGLR